MKKFALLTAAALCAASFFASCDNNDDPKNPPVGDSTSTGNLSKVWYEITNHGEFTAKEYADSILRVFPTLGESPASSALINGLTAQLPEAVRIETYTFNYKSKDGQDREVKLSGLLVVPTLGGKALIGQNLILENRPTQTGNEYLPSNKYILGNLLCLSGNSLVVSDLLGYGVSKDSVMSYCCQHIAARNSVDAAIAAQYMLTQEDCGSLSRAPLPVINVGYSQGGYDALAVQKYMETSATDDEKALVDIKKSFCGAGPYDLNVLQNTVSQLPAYLYSPFLLINNLSVLHYHGVGDYTINDFLSEKAQAAKLVDMLNSRKLENNMLIGWATQNIGTAPSDFFSADMVNPESGLYKTLSGVLESESLVKGWTPRKPVYFFHGKYDDCVPVQCTMAAEQAFKHLSNVRFDYDETPCTEPGLHSNLAATFYLKLFKLMAE